MLKAIRETGKIIATPTSAGWAQAYSAGGLFITLSLTKEQGEVNDTLATLGKKLINDIEAEFFALEEKSLDTIKKIVVAAFDTVPSHITVSAPFAYQKEAFLYVFLFGAGRILLKRADRLGVLLEENDQTVRSIKTASGRLHDGDLVFLHTKGFLTAIGETQLVESLSTNNIDEIEEELMPHVHNKEGSGDASAIFFVFYEQKSELPEKPIEDEAKKATYPLPQEPEVVGTLTHPVKKAHVRITLTHRQRMLGSITLALVIVFFLSILFASQRREDVQNQKVFSVAFMEASKHYEEGEGLVHLNAQLAREELKRAKSIIDEAKRKLPERSKERKELLALGEKVQKLLDEVSGEKAIRLSNATDSDSLLLAKRRERGVLYTVQDEDTVYVLTAEEISSVAKGNETKKTIIKNNGDWENVGGFGTFNSNLYVLERDEGILKFVPGSEGYGKSFYFMGNAPNLSKAVSIAIDSAIYILFADGTVRKYFRGEAERFQITGLNRSFNQPLDIYTAESLEYIYILDAKNARVVRVDKNGAYVNQYSSSELKDALALDVSEDEKNIYVLIGKTIKKFQIR